MLYKRNYQRSKTTHTQEFKVVCDDCGWSIYVHHPNNTEQNHITLASRHEINHDHNCSILQKTLSEHLILIID